jgi:hypothetical protein
VPRATVVVQDADPSVLFEEAIKPTGKFAQPLNRFPVRVN